MSNCRSATTWASWFCQNHRSVHRSGAYAAWTKCIFVGIDFYRMIPEVYSLLLLDQGATESVWCPKSPKPLKQVEWCSVVNKEVWCYLCLYQRTKPSKLLSKWKWCSEVNKTATKADSKSAFMQMSVKTALKQDKFTGSEGRLDPTECEKCGLQGHACKGELGFYWGW